MRWAVLVPLLLLSRAALAQQPMPCRPVSGGFVCPGDLVCNAQLQCVATFGPAPTQPRSGATMRDSGIALTILGLALEGMTVLLLSDGHCIQSTYVCTGSYSNGSGSFDCQPAIPVSQGECHAAIATMLGGLAAFGVGIPLWAVGQHHLNQDARRAQLYLAPVDGGAIAGVRITSF